MGIFPQSNIVYPPKVGASATFEITGELQRIKNEGDEHNYKDKNKKNLGYYDVLPVDGDKQLKINTWKVYFALKEINPAVGDLIEISHVASGNYKIVKL